MKELKERIIHDGIVIDNRILKVDSFLNQQLDPALICHIGTEFARRFSDTPIDRIVTIESSGIAVAYAAALAMKNIPVVFARKKMPSHAMENTYHTSVYSYTKEETYEVAISKQFLPAGESVLIIDDFLASGEAALGLASLLQEAQCNVAGIGIVIEKSFQPGRQRLQEAGYRVEALAQIEKFENDRPVFNQAKS
ncbi:xanthine phosphoribosyltransferase [Megasphaera paucivorans]|uniref:Xanthine phosphoribosyltransferase n=1 Tax=Megasphaera paucivorans TaxID=349095 RepID=A0A1G9ZLZ5_9FIRM|nr:xanthine phosphoribosyltransferase [Megasphaera paucivorans]SDN22389.1 xanthine phosphoribosyltransferase [Megasphaera paucivorans]